MVELGLHEAEHRDADDRPERDHEAHAALAGVLTRSQERARDGGGRGDPQQLGPPSPLPVVVVPDP